MYHHKVTRVQARNYPTNNRSCAGCIYDINGTVKCDDCSREAAYRQDELMTRLKAVNAVDPHRVMRAANTHPADSFFPPVETPVVRSVRAVSSEVLVRVERPPRRHECHFTGMPQHRAAADPNCLVTREEVEAAMARFEDGREKLPVWHKEEQKGAGVREAEYDRSKMQTEWNEYHKAKEMQEAAARKPAAIAETARTRAHRSESVEKRRVTFAADGGSRLARSLSATQQCGVQMDEEDEKDVCRPFYGSNELETSCNNAIKFTLRAQKALRHLKFSAGATFPQADDYILITGEMFKQLKQFNTHVRHQTKNATEKIHDRPTADAYGIRFETTTTTVPQKYPQRVAPHPQFDGARATRDLHNDVVLRRVRATRDAADRVIYQFKY